MWYVNLKGIWFTIKTRRAAHDKRRDLRMAKGRSRTKISEVYIRSDPGTDPIIGVRIPKLRTLAKKIAKEDWRGYLEHAACDTYEEIMLQGLVLGYAKGEIDELLEYVRAFIPKIHDWSINDCFCATFKIAQKHREKVWNFLMPYAKSDQEFEQRVVAVMLMDHFLTEAYIARVLAVWDRLDHRDITGKWELRGALQLHMQVPKGNTCIFTGESFG